MGGRDLTGIHGTVEEGREKLAGRLVLTGILGTPRPRIGREGVSRASTELWRGAGKS